MIKCKNPTIIINPAVYEYVGLWRGIVLDNRFYNMLFANKLNLKSLYNTLKDIKSHLDPTEDYSEVYYCYDRFERKSPVFISVPCNQCVLCKSKRQASLVQRLQFECECHKYEPYFVTLTHNRYSLPKNNTPSLRTIQLYMKRLRNYSSEKYQTELRYYAQGEKGKKHGRAHYHFLIFGLPLLSHDEQIELFSLAWRTVKSYKTVRKGEIVNIKLPLGRVHVTHVNSKEYREWYKKNKGRELKETDGIRYACKYSTKNSVVQTWSCRLGCEYVEKTYKKLLHRPNAPIDLIFKNRYGSSTPVIKDRWFFQTVFDTYNRSTYKFRSIIYDMIQCDCYNYHKKNGHFHESLFAFNKRFYDYMNIDFDLLNYERISDIWLKKWLSKMFQKRNRTILRRLTKSPIRSQLRYISDTFFDVKFWSHLQEEEYIYREYLKRCFANIQPLTADEVDFLYRKKKYYSKLVEDNQIL